jgi:CRISPR-associated protein Csb1
MPLKIDLLKQATNEHAAIRRRQRMQPAGGAGDTVFPPTYPGEGRSGPRHVFEKRRVNGQDVQCALIDSVQSGSNWSEAALREAARDGLVVPRVVVDFSTEFPDIGEITSLDAPHRLFDAILRDSLLDGIPFMASELGKRLQTAKMSDATVVFETSPSALLFGVWNSTGEGGGLGAKFPRCLVSEIVGVGVSVEPVPGRRDGDGRIRETSGYDSEVHYQEVQSAGRRTSSRIDPLGIQKQPRIFKGESGWDVVKEAAGKNAKEVRPSEINHGNITPSISPLGVTMDYAEQTTVLSLAGLRRLRFGSKQRDEAARTLIAALGLVAILERDRQGYALRSRCDLVCDSIAPLELVHYDGTTERLDCSRSDAHSLYTEALAAARSTGFTLSDEPIRLQPQPKLIEIIKRSRALALAGKGGESDESDAGS